MLNSLLGFLRSRALAAEVRAASDGQLLARFSAEHDNDAFAGLVYRYGPMVWCVCRRVLGNEADAEDAFQATFLVLARKGTALARTDLVAGWLHGVASRTAMAARSAAARRRFKERRAEEARRPDTTLMSTEDAPWAELRPLLDTELARLPKKYQTAIVLCDLEGKSRRDAARLLRLAEGTLSSRLARGRRLLARRLSRHVPTVSGGAVASALAAETTAAVPSAVVISTVQAARAFAAAGKVAAGVISARVALLAEGVLKMMFLSKVKIATGVVLATTLVCAGAGLFASGMLGGGPDEAPPAVLVGAQDREKPDGNDANVAPIRRKEAPRRGGFVGRERDGVRLEIRLKEELAGLKPDFQALGRQKVNAAKEAFASALELFELATAKGGGQRAFDIMTLMLDCSNKLLAAELEISARHSDRLAALERHWMVARKAEILAETNYRAGRLGPQELYPMRYHRIDAEIQLLKAREGK